MHQKNDKLTRWALWLQEFNTVWSYSPGAEIMLLIVYPARVDGQVTVSVLARVTYPGGIYCDSCCVTVYLFRAFCILSH